MTYRDCKEKFCRGRGSFRIKNTDLENKESGTRKTKKFTKNFGSKRNVTSYFHYVQGLMNLILTGSKFSYTL